MGQLIQNDITFNNVKLAGNSTVNMGQWPIILAGQQGPDEDGGIINVVDIDWNGAQLNGETINTTGNLLGWMDNITKGLSSSITNAYTLINDIDKRPYGSNNILRRTSFKDKKWTIGNVNEDKWHLLFSNISNEDKENYQDYMWAEIFNETDADNVKSDIMCYRFDTRNITFGENGFISFYQNLYKVDKINTDGTKVYTCKLKPNTWYTLSFWTRGWDTNNNKRTKLYTAITHCKQPILYVFKNGKAIDINGNEISDNDIDNIGNPDIHKTIISTVDDTVIIDGVKTTNPGAFNTHIWEIGWTMEKHTYTFKTGSIINIDEDKTTLQCKTSVGWERVVPQLIIRPQEPALFSIGQIQLEEGKVATAWSENIQDIKDDVYNSSILSNLEERIKILENKAHIYNITLNVINGSITNGKQTQSITSGQTVTWTIAPDDWYQLPTSIGNNATIDTNGVITYTASDNINTDIVLNVTCPDAQDTPDQDLPPLVITKHYYICFNTINTNDLGYNYTKFIMPDPKNAFVMYDLMFEALNVIKNTDSPYITEISDSDKTINFTLNDYTRFNNFRQCVLIPWDYVKNGKIQIIGLRRNSRSGIISEAVFDSTVQLQLDGYHINIEPGWHGALYQESEYGTGILDISDKFTYFGLDDDKLVTNSAKYVPNDKIYYHVYDHVEYILFEFNSSLYKKITVSYKE